MHSGIAFLIRKRNIVFAILSVSFLIVALICAPLLYYQLGYLAGYLFVLIIFLPSLMVTCILYPEVIKLILPTSLHTFVSAITDIMKYFLVLGLMLFSIFYVISKVVYVYNFNLPLASVLVSLASSILLARKRSEYVDYFVSTILGRRPISFESRAEKLFYYVTRVIGYLALVILLTPYSLHVFGFNIASGILESIRDVGLSLFTLYILFLSMAVAFSPIEEVKGGLNRKQVMRLKR